MTRKREGWARPPSTADTSDIYYVKGSSLSKRDLGRCYVDQAYAVVLLGDRDDENLSGERE